jgi:acetylornithine deacetylase/succinyl-diaminopimelate desuccinylase-like protein
MEINGLYSGYINEGSKTIIPNYALAKFSFRLVEYQEPNEIINLVKKFVKDNIPNGVKYNLKVLASAKPFYCDFNNYYLQNVAKILESHFKNKCIFQREGGSIPVAEILMTKFKKPVIITGFTLPGSNIHAPNENIDYNLFFEGIKALKKIYSFEF